MSENFLLNCLYLRESKNTQHINSLAKLAIWLKKLKHWNNSSWRLCAFMLSTDGFTCVNFGSYFMLSSLRWEMEGWHFLMHFHWQVWAEIITSTICLMTVQWGKMNDDSPWHLHFGWERKRVCPCRENKYLVKIKSYWIRQYS